MDRSKLKKFLLSFLKIVISITALYFVYTKIELTEVKKLWQSLRPIYLLLAICCFVLSKLVSAYRLNYFFRSVNLQLSNSVNIKLYILGMFYNIFLPGGIGGDSYKIFFLHKHFKAPLKTIFLAVFSDRVSGMIILVFLTSILSLFFPQLRLYSFWVLILSLVGIFVCLFITKQYVTLFKKIISIVLIQSFFVQLLQILCFVFLLLSYCETTNFLPYIFTFLVSSIVIIIPISVGGLGLRELSFLLGVQYLNITKELAVNLSFTFYLITAFVSLCGIMYIFKPILYKTERHKDY